MKLILFHVARGNGDFLGTKYLAKGFVFNPENLEAPSESAGAILVHVSRDIPWKEMGGVFHERLGSHDIQRCT